MDQVCRIFLRISKFYADSNNGTFIPPSVVEPALEEATLLLGVHYVSKRLFCTPCGVSIAQVRRLSTKYVNFFEIIFVVL